MMNIASKQTYQDGQIIIQEGSSGDWVYVVLSGTVEISKNVKGKEVSIEFLQPGEVFGELGFLGGVQRTATAKAVGETTVGIVDREFLDQEFNKLYLDFRNILIAVVQRFKKMVERVSELSPPKETHILETLSLKYKDKNSFISAYKGGANSGELFVRTENPLKQGEQFLLKLQLPNLAEPLEVKCEVAWIRKSQEKASISPDGMEIKFIEMTKKNHQMLKQYLAAITR